MVIFIREKRVESLGIISGEFDMLLLVFANGYEITPDLFITVITRKGEYRKPWGRGRNRGLGNFPSISFLWTKSSCWASSWAQCRIKSKPVPNAVFTNFTLLHIWLHEKTTFSNFDSSCQQVRRHFYRLLSHVHFLQKIVLLTIYICYWVEICYHIVYFWFRITILQLNPIFYCS